MGTLSISLEINPVKVVKGRIDDHSWYQTSRLGGKPVAQPPTAATNTMHFASALGFSEVEQRSSVAVALTHTAGSNFLTRPQSTHFYSTIHVFGAGNLVYTFMCFPSGAAEMERDHKPLSPFGLTSSKVLKIELSWIFGRLTALPMRFFVRRLGRAGPSGFFRPGVNVVEPQLEAAAALASIWSASQGQFLWDDQGSST